ncbi:hypothetical protein BGW80DRAFT_1334858 [Lactifluus volemus]|nr:hypothetical protein BGW80DRAFT_1334858 [Lactifluus volemus]
MRARVVTGIEVGPFCAVADVLEVIPRTLMQNAGVNAIRALMVLCAAAVQGDRHCGL